MPKFSIPTYVEDHPQGAEYIDPAATIVVSPGTMMRISLGDGAEDPSIVIERRRNGWCVILASNQQADPEVVSYITDQKQVLVLPDFENIPNLQFLDTSPNPNPVDVPVPENGS